MASNGDRNGIRAKATSVQILHGPVRKDKLELSRTERVEREKTNLIMMANLVTNGQPVPR